MLGIFLAHIVHLKSIIDENSKGARNQCNGDTKANIILEDYFSFGNDSKSNFFFLKKPSLKKKL